MSYTELIIEQIRKLTGKEHVMLTTRCNAAIMLALKLAKQLGYNSVTIPDWGGWMTYEQFAQKLKLPVHKLLTSDGQIDVRRLHLESKTILITHSLAGYHWRLDTRELAAVAKRDGALFIEDVCGTIGEPTFGDIIVCSFGTAKPVNFGTGGCLATNNSEYFAAVKAINANAVPVEFETHELLDKLTPVNLERRKHRLFAKRDELREIFSNAGFIAEGDSKALVLIVPYTSDTQKAAIQGICTTNGVEWTECPRYIRSGKQAISVEIKRL